MEVTIYGLYDRKTGNFGDLCTLRCDQEFVDGLLRMFKDSDLPDYYLEDMVGFAYGKLISHAGDYPEIKPFDVPRVVFYGRSLINNRTLEVNNE